MTTKPKLGRPPSGNEPRTMTVYIRLTQTELAQAKRLAEAEERSLAQWARRVIAAEIKKGVGE